MSLLRQLPEFIRAQELVKANKWATAAAQFSRCTEIMDHANQDRDSSVANMFSGACNFYSGDMIHASTKFHDSFKRLSTIKGLGDKASKTAHELYLCTQLELHVQNNKSVVWPPTDTPMEYMQSDPWTQLAHASAPTDGFARSVYELAVSGVDMVDEASSGKEFEAVAWANLRKAYSAVSMLPKANSTGASIDREVKTVNLALKSGEHVRAFGHEMTNVGSWYVCNALILRGTLFEFNGNALMAEGMYRAASDMADHTPTPRMGVAKRVANYKLGDLLLRWEKREREGQQLIEANPNPDKQLVDLCINTFVGMPQFSTLDEILD